MINNVTARLPVKSPLETVCDVDLCIPELLRKGCVTCQIFSFISFFLIFKTTKYGVPEQKKDLKITKKPCKSLHEREL